MSYVDFYDGRNIDDLLHSSNQGAVKIMGFNERIIPKEIEKLSINWKDYSLHLLEFIACKFRNFLKKIRTLFDNIILLTGSLAGKGPAKMQHLEQIYRTTPLLDILPVPLYYISGTSNLDRK